MTLAVILAGDISEGFEAIGPFADFDRGVIFAEVYLDKMNWVMILNPPDDSSLHSVVKERDVDQAQVDAEETISELIFDRGESFQTDDGIDEEVCNQLGRDILQRIVHELSIKEFIELQSMIAPPDSVKA